MKLISIVGARPQFVKLSPLTREIDLNNAKGSSVSIEHRIVHTGQHYDNEMSEIFFDELDLPVADFRLPACSGTHAFQTAAMLKGVEHVLEQERPDVVLVYGDTNSTLAGVLAAAKLSIPLAHVEAGLRSFDRRMPEEINRIVADHVSDLLLAPTATAMRNLAMEGLAPRSMQTGDLMYDSLLHYRAIAARTSTVLSKLSLEPGEYGLVTLHRAGNTDNGARIVALLAALNDIASESLSLVFPLHPRTAARLSNFLPRWRPHPRLKLTNPVGYLDTLALLSNARVTLTDSGGLQKEAFFVGCPCVTLRSETEWHETVEAGANVLTDADPARIRAAVAQWSARYPRGNADFAKAADSAFGHGLAASNILAHVVQLGEKPRNATARAPIMLPTHFRTNVEGMHR
jgi:UDP-N-acetylglucosamine 2-epimerase